MILFFTKRCRYARALTSLSACFALFCCFVSFAKVWELLNPRHVCFYEKVGTEKLFSWGHTDQLPTAANPRSGFHNGLSTTSPGAAEPGTNQLSIDQLLDPWSDIVENTTLLSSYCSELIFYSVLVLSRDAEPRIKEAKVVKPNIKTPQCAILLALELETSSRPGLNQNGRPSSVISAYAKNGWNVVSTKTWFSEGLARRVSRYPKLQPQVFFPHTRQVLFSDVKYLHKFNSLDAYAVTATLLAGSQLGVVQHPKGYSLLSERDNILSQLRKRPSIVDDVELMDAQVARLSTSIPLVHQTQFLVDGGLHARVIHGVSNSSSFDGAWMSEYIHGCDRDQIAFFGAAYELRLRRESMIPCSNFNRAGVYRSERIRNFTLAIHCGIDSVLGCTRSPGIS